jgi:hypothetical protein
MNWSWWGTGATGSKETEQKQAYKGWQKVVQSKEVHISPPRFFSFKVLIVRTCNLLCGAAVVNRTTAHSVRDGRGVVHL